jgi:hypothetical protein
MMILAYIDPGAGSLLIQALIAAALSVPFLFRRSLRAVTGRLRHRRSEPADDQLPPGGAD